MLVFLLNVLIIIAVMWALLRLMYPKPPKDFMPQAGDDTTLQACSYCGHTLATYRGIVKDNGDFFCNQAHEAAFYDGLLYDGNETTPPPPPKNNR